MKNACFTAVLCLGLAAAPAYARSGVNAPVNGTVAAVMLRSGGVMLQIKLPAAAIHAISREMKQSRETCIIQNVTGAAGMILICGPAGTKVP